MRTRLIIATILFLWIAEGTFGADADIKLNSLGFLSAAH